MNKDKFTVQFDPRSLAHIDRWSTDSESKAEFIRQALALEDIFREARSKGGKFLILNFDGTMAEIVRP
jgi:hypothetical protein